MKIINRTKKTGLNIGDVLTILSKEDINSLSDEARYKLKNENPGFIGDMYQFCGFTVVVYNSSNDECNVYNKISEKKLPYTWHISYFKEYYQ